MIQMVYPEPGFRIRNNTGKEEIFDTLRRQWVRLTPEEWVRQHILHWFITVLAYPSSLVSVEKELRVGTLRKRYDLLVFNKEMEPWMLVECKAPEVPLTEETLLQVMRYNMKMKASFLVICNGHEVYAADIRSSPAKWLESMPVFPV
jgi:hypothetical protein